MKRLLIPFFIAAVIGATSLTASANPWHPENNAHRQPTFEETENNLPDNCTECESDDGAWELISKLVYCPVDI